MPYTIFRAVSFDTPSASRKVSTILCLHHPEMKITPYEEKWKHTIGGEAPDFADGSNETLFLTPARYDTDGFFVALMRKAG